MADERVYTVNGAVATPARPVSLTEAGLKERSDLQEWVLAHPEILGHGVKIVTAEFDRWEAGNGERPLDRLDVLGLDLDGRLVVAELKRDRAPDTVEMQAVKYAAFVSRFTEEQLVAAHSAHLLRQRPADALDEEAARLSLLDHVGGELDVELLRQPRIVLLAGSFPPSVTAAAVWLGEMGVDVSLQRVQAYRIDGPAIVVTVTQLLPVPEVEDLSVGPRQGTVARVRRRRERSGVVKIIVAGAIDDLTALRLVPPDDVPESERGVIGAWVAGAPDRGRATWRNDRRHPIVWAADGSGYRPTPLAREILRQTGLPDRPLSGSSWWVLPDGSTLAHVASRIAGGFDWTALHSILESIPAGRWTTYGDLAATVGTGPVALGQHISNCPACKNAWRVLGADGRARSGFEFLDPARIETQEEALRGEGVTFVDGVADGSLRVALGDLETLGASD